MRDLNVMLTVGCGVIVFGIVEALASADLRVAAFLTLFLLCVLVWWMVARRREREYLDGPPDCH